MKITTQTKVGQVMYNFTIDENEEMKALHKAIVLSNPRRKCNECNSFDQAKFKLDSNKDKQGNIYVNVVCLSCGSKSKLGQYKAGGYFWHKFEKYNPQGTTQTQTTTPSPEDFAGDVNEDSNDMYIE